MTRAFNEGVGECKRAAWLDGGLKVAGPGEKRKAAASDEPPCRPKWGSGTDQRGGAWGPRDAAAFSLCKVEGRQLFRVSSPITVRRGESADGTGGMVQGVDLE